MTNGDNKNSIDNIRSRISEIISTMSGIEMQKLLMGLEKWQKAKRISKNVLISNFGGLYE